MKSRILSEVFAALCESQTHFDSLLSKLDPSKKSKAATLLGAFLRRPWTLATHYKIQLAATPDEFWKLGFIPLKKHPGIHATLQELWEKWESAPREGNLNDFPPAMSAQWVADWGVERAEAIAKYLTQDPLTTLRFHRSAYGPDGALLPDIQTWLKSEGLPKSREGHFSKSARVFSGFAVVQKNDFFKSGRFEIQDEGSQIMSLFALDPSRVLPLLSSSPQTSRNRTGSLEPGVFSDPMTVIDACAGAGGKTLAMADALQGKGRIYAYDLFESKIKNLKKRVERANERNVQARLLSRDATGELVKFESTADVVLVDAPCSGLGVLRRNPDTKWNRKPLELKKRENERPITEIQYDVLSQYSKLAKIGGRVVYGVCTFTRDESVGIVERFLKQNPGYEFESGGFTGPFDTDGFYMASLIRKS
jgi:16S rRNA C967 or C1407 C5-methylase (RsmB/RsmF family)